jgi:dUTP pyrophosphatase
MLNDVAVQLTLVTGDDSFIPRYASDGDAGCDGKANIKEPVILFKGEPVVIPLGIKAAIPKGFEVQVRSRSGLAAKHGVIVLNAPGTIDETYRGEWGAILINHSRVPFQVNPGDRICQLVLNKVEQIKWELVEELSTTERGEGGFGSTGV